MRYVVLMLVVAAALGGLWLALDGEEASKASIPVALQPSASDLALLEATPSPPDTLVVGTPQPETGPTSSDATEPAPQSEESAALTLVGTVSDRFGAVQVGEHLYAVPVGRLHPATPVEAADLPHTQADAEGSFALTLPDAGPWRLAVGAPGRPRMPLSEAVELGPRSRADVVVPGASAITLSFDEWPAASGVVTLEIEALVERPRVDQKVKKGKSKEDKKARKEDKRKRTGDTEEISGLSVGAGQDAASDSRRGRGRGARRGEDPGGLATEDGSRREGRRGRRGGDDPGAREEGQRSDEKRDKRGAGERRDRPRPDAVELEELGPVDAPLPEVWRVAHRRELGSSASALELTSLPAGEVHRVCLRLGTRQLEGVERFVLQPDTRVEVRVFPPGVGSTTLTYTAVTHPLRFDESPEGVHWRD